MRRILKDVGWIAEMSLAIVLMCMALGFFTVVFKVQEVIGVGQHG